MLLTYLTICTAYCTMVACVMEVTLLVDVPESPRSNTSMRPFSVSVNRMFRELSMLIWVIGSSSLNVRFRNEGIRNDSVPVEWFSFLHRFPNQLHAPWINKTSLYTLILISHSITKIGIQWGNSYWKNEQVPRRKAHQLYCMFISIYSLLIDNDLCKSQNASIKFLCACLVYLCLSSRLHFSGKSSPF